MMAYFSAVSALCGRMLSSFAVALGMTADFFCSIFRRRAERQVALPALPAAGYD
jgi:isopenicillin N synthase-like dioxygenase